MIGFCAGEVKKLMMMKAGKGVSLVQRVWKNTLLVCVCAIAVATSALAYDLYPHNKNIQYTYYQSEAFSLSYRVAWDVMAPIYKGTMYDKADPPAANPMIAIGEADLNGDRMPEIIAYPVEELEEENMFCKGAMSCPHYVLEVRGKKVRTLGIIYADSLDLGDENKNGYRTLKAYTQEMNKENPHYFETYAYDPKKDEYVKQATPKQ